ncbi:hypothetical protein LCGC14_2576530 [marine sediment metagenome]|uniref:Uncharacterized protein n=1 Tax=marine sediment metagenome TaxID=412755 RepID=A0A0F9B3K8_9ZZZZ
MPLGKAIGLLVAFALAVITGFWVGYVSGYFTGLSTPEPVVVIDNPRATTGYHVTPHIMRFYRGLTVAADDKPSDKAKDRCNYEGFVGYQTSMLRDAGVNLEETLDELVELHKQLKEKPGVTQSDIMTNMIFMGLVTRQAYASPHMKPIDFAIAVYNVCIIRFGNQKKPDIQA